MQKRIIVIDNDQDILEVIETALTMENYSVETTPIVDDIFEMINDKKPDLILIDYLLFGINGGELCHMIKSEPTTSHLPVIIFSGYPKVIQSLGTYECNAFISKPFDLENFMEIIRECLSKNSSADFSSSRQ